MLAELAALAWVFAAAAPTGVIAAPCDLSIEFKARKGQVDQAIYQRTKTWLDEQPDVAGYEEIGPDRKMGLKLCIAARSEAAIRPTFMAMTIFAANQYQGGGEITLRHRFGGSYLVKPFKRPGSPVGVPRDNGVSVRPPVGERN